MEVFAEHGYESATISQITERAGVSRGLISYYFAAKQDLLETILGRYLDGLLSLFADLDPHDDPDYLLAAVIDRTLQSAASGLAGQRLLLCLMVQPSIRTVYADVERSRAAAMEAAEEWLRAVFARRGADDPAVEEVMLRSVLEGAIFKLAVYEHRYPLTAIRARLYDLYGLSEPGPLPLPADTFGGHRHLRYLPEEE
ncbi:TetR/AcrR family transcriptional regulator [Catenuloplanes indicus JCM 9534]|uniref:AcrR family transcriptional regulator n=2 Tax=Catenuloplanes indicus TaxID=137267 RepID=A0AAE3VVF9_9ACTN|nr:AcrR family transcriptional regulator [Catenuloplanes indicus]